MYDTAPRGLASNTGFEAEDARLSARLAQNALNAQYHRTVTELEKLSSMIWKQSKYRYLCNEKDFISRFLADMEMVAHEYAIEGVLPKDNVNP